MERKISYFDALYVLRHGVHEKEKSTFDARRRAWKYAIRGKTLDDVEARVVVAFVGVMVVVTVIKLMKKKSRRVS